MDWNLTSVLLLWGAMGAVAGTVMAAHAYVFHCTHMAQMLSEPQIMTRIRNEETQQVEVVDDYREAYHLCSDALGRPRCLLCALRLAKVTADSHMRQSVWCYDAACNSSFGDICLRWAWVLQVLAPA
eukprot:COSAG05_NODE_2103_length_3555_cov_3.669271_5_plen_127_part_00